MTFDGLAPYAFPQIIQGGMGAGISTWVLARSVALKGQLGVVSGSMLDTILVRRLQDGDVGGHVRRAMAKFPMPEISGAVLRRYFRPEGRKTSEAYRLLPMYRQPTDALRQRITMLANFVEVYLAKEGHGGSVGLNLLTKVQIPNLASLYGAMLAGVDYVLMGAGIPREIPGALDAFVEHGPASIKFEVEGLPRGEAEYLTFDPRAHGAPVERALRRPKFLPIVSSDTLAASLAHKANGRVDGFVFEAPVAGGHNAPPRGALRLSDLGEPIYGERDLPDLQRVRDLGLPFWMAGGTGTADGLRTALEAGAAGIQVGTLFAYCEESGLAPELKRQVLAGVAEGKVHVHTDPRVSPTGFPFKVVELEGADFQDDRRKRVCDLGYLRNAFRDAAGKLGYRCPAEPVDAYLAKGGAAADTEGRRCLCNALLANVGEGQVRPDGAEEKPLLTSGDDLVGILKHVGDRVRFAAADVVDYLRSAVSAADSRPEASASTAAR
jgi:NAD(P)H-dependent flavin oxidoreductase YrpB (nitropropane dioxygenase family)